MHTNEGPLRAYLDGELNERAGAAVAAHLRECAACRLQLESLASRASAASQHLQALAPHAAELPAPAPVALSRLHTRLANQQAGSVSQDRPPLRQPEGGFVEMFKQVFNSRYRAALAGLAAMLVVALLLTLAPVQAAASQFLGLFRIRKFAVVSINPAALQSLDQVGGQIDQLLSDSATFAKRPGAPVAVASVAEAAQRAGILVRLPSTVKSAPRLVVEDGVNATVKVDLARIRAILELAGRSDIQLPGALDGANAGAVAAGMEDQPLACRRRPNRIDPGRWSGHGAGAGNSSRVLARRRGYYRNQHVRRESSQTGASRLGKKCARH